MLVNSAGSLRLVNTSSNSSLLQSSGRLEIYFGGEWGTVCNDLFMLTAADISCRQLGFSGVSAFGSAADYPGLGTYSALQLDTFTNFLMDEYMA